MKKFGKAGIVLLVVFVIAGILFQTNKAGHFQVKQAFITGKITTRVLAGTYWQGFGKISDFKNVATIGYGNSKGEGSADIPVIPVIFNDGSKANISGLVRVKLPNSKPGGEALITEYSEGFDHFIVAGVLPVIKNAVKLSANLRSAQDAYTTLALFQQAVEDQLIYGTYVTQSKVVYIDRTSGKTIADPGKDDDVEEKKVTIVVIDDVTGLPKRVPNRLSELNCEILECVVDVPDFDPKVQEMIAKRKDEAMKTELSKQEAIRAKQDAITAKEQGIADVAKAKYEEEVIKERAVVNAEKSFQVAEFEARQAKEVAKKIEAEGRAKAAANKALVSAGLTPIERANIEKDTAIGVAAELAKVKFPEMLIIGGGEGNGPMNPFDAVGLEAFQKISKSISGK